MVLLPATPALPAITVNGVMQVAAVEFAKHQRNQLLKFIRHLPVPQLNAGQRLKKGKGVREPHVPAAIAGSMEAEKRSSGLHHILYKHLIKKVTYGFP